MKENNRKKTNIFSFIRSHLFWLGFSAVVLLIFYVYFSVLFEAKHIILDFIYALLLAFLLYGIAHAFLFEKKKNNFIKPDYRDVIFIIFGVFSTYSLVHFIGLFVVISSAAVGIIGHFLFRKYEAAVYCGSFAGMVSVELFGFTEVAVLAIVCSIIYIMTKPLFKGYGGKLGTIAFMSSLIVHSIFRDSFLVITTNFNLFFLISTTVVGVFSTFYLQHRFNISSVFSSAIMTLIVAVFLVFIFPVHKDYVIVFFSASFIGMSSKDKLPNIYFVLISGIVLGLIYYIFVEFFNGLGGKLGLLAFISVITTTGISKLLNKELEKVIIKK